MEKDAVGDDRSTHSRVLYPQGVELQWGLIDISQRHRDRVDNDCDGISDDNSRGD